MKILTLDANNRDTHKLHKFDRYIKDGKNVFVMFHMNGCGHCIQALPEWRTIITRINNKLKNNDNIVIADIESSHLSKIKNASNIEGFPTIRYIYNYGNSHEDYNGPRLVSDFIKWIESKIPGGPSVGATFKGGKRGKGRKYNKTQKRVSRQQPQPQYKVDFDFDLFIQNLFYRKK
jgi:hypothetical protein